MKESLSKTSDEFLTCPVCQKKMRTITTQHIRTHGYPDAKSFKKTFGLVSLKCQSMRKKQSSFMAQNSPTVGGHRPESIEKMKRERKGKGNGVAGKYERTPEIRRKIAEGVLAAWEQGKRNRGFYVYSRHLCRKVWVRSSWEARVLHVLDVHPCVEHYEVEPFRIPYIFEDVEHIYIPDFRVELEGGITEVWEVKPKELTGHPRNVAKMEALNAFVSKHHYNSRLVTLEHIQGMEMQVGIREWEGPGGPWVRPEDPNFRPRSPEEQQGFKDPGDA
jgi:hypothetical protein